MRIAVVVTHFTYLLQENFVSMNTLQDRSLFTLFSLSLASASVAMCRLRMEFL